MKIEKAAGPPRFATGTRVIWVCPIKVIKDGKLVETRMSTNNVVGVVAEDGMVDWPDWPYTRTNADDYRVQAVVE
jgi:hypothetical protein